MIREQLMRRYIEQLEEENARLRMELDAAVKVHTDWIASVKLHGQRQSGMHAGMKRTTEMES
jgi:hypothetical protein